MKLDPDNCVFEAYSLSYYAAVNILFCTHLFPVTMFSMQYPAFCHAYVFYVCYYSYKRQYVPVTAPPFTITHPSQSVYVLPTPVQTTTSSSQRYVTTSRTTSQSPTPRPSRPRDVPLGVKTRRNKQTQTPPLSPVHSPYRSRSHDVLNEWSDMSPHSPRESIERTYSRSADRRSVERTSIRRSTDRRSIDRQSIDRYIAERRHSPLPPLKPGHHWESTEFIRESSVVSDDEAGEPAVIRRVYQFEEVLTRVPDEPAYVVERYEDQDIRETYRDVSETRRDVSQTYQDISTSETRTSSDWVDTVKRPQQLGAPILLNQQSTGYHVFPPTPMQPPPPKPLRSSMTTSETVHKTTRTERRSIVEHSSTGLERHSSQININVEPSTQYEETRMYRAQSEPQLDYPKQYRPITYAAPEPRRHTSQLDIVRPSSRLRPVDLDIELPQEQSSTVEYREERRYKTEQTHVQPPQLPQPKYEPVQFDVVLPPQHTMKVQYPPKPKYEPVELDVAMPQSHTTEVKYTASAEFEPVEMNVKMPELHTSTVKYQQEAGYEPVELDVTMPSQHTTKIDYKPQPGFETVEMDVDMPKQHTTKVDYRTQPGFEPVEFNVKMPQQHTTTLKYKSEATYEPVELDVDLPKQHTARVDYSAQPGFEPVEMDVKMPEQHTTTVRYQQEKGFEPVNIDVEMPKQHTTKLKYKQQKGFEPVKLDITLPEQHTTRLDYNTTQTFETVEMDVALPKQHTAQVDYRTQPGFEPVELDVDMPKQRTTKLNYKQEPGFAPVNIDVELPKQHLAKIDFSKPEGFDQVDLDIQMDKRHTTTVNYQQTTGFEPVNLDVDLPQQHKVQADYPARPMQYGSVELDIALPKSVANTPHTIHQRPPVPRQKGFGSQYRAPAPQNRRTRSETPEIFGQQLPMHPVRRSTSTEQNDSGIDQGDR